MVVGKSGGGGGGGGKYLENCDPLLSHKNCFSPRAKEVGWGQCFFQAIQFCS